MTTLNDLPIGKTATVAAVGGEGSLRQHFLDMGIIPLVDVTMVKHAPMGDPLEVRIHSYELTLRRDDARKIEIVDMRDAADAQESRPLGKPVPHPGLGEGGKQVSCPNCGGKGRVVTVQRTFLGDMQSATTCPQCNGTGTSIENPCPECEGQGRVPDRQKVTVEVPAGIRDGQQLRVAGFGEAGMQGAAAGDLIVTVRIQPHEFYERDGDDLHARVSISMVQAALGAELEIDGIFDDEDVPVRVPEGAQNGQIIRVKGYGMPRLRSEKRGDMYVHLDVEIPKKLSKRERELLEELAREMGEDVSEARSPLQKLRDIFD